MKIAYITTGNPHNKHSWSGTNYYIKKALEQQGHSVYCIYGYKKNTLKTLLYKSIAYITKKIYQADRTTTNSKEWAQYILANLQKDTDVIFSLSTIPVAFLSTTIPIYIYIDGIFEYMLKNGFKNLLNSFKEAHLIEEMAIKNCTKIITSSVASANDIQYYYNINDSKIKIVPLGANIDFWPSKHEIKNIISSRSNNRCKILFVGVEWERKGADIVIETCNKLYDSGFPIELHIVGLKTIPIPLPNYAVNHGFINKMGIDGTKELSRIYQESHFLFVPSRGEAYGLVFCEASAHGLPSISHSIGGIPTIIKNGINGELFEIGTSTDTFASYIKDTFLNHQSYYNLSMSAYNRFTEELNWNIAGDRLNHIINYKK